MSTETQARERRVDTGYGRYTVQGEHVHAAYLDCSPVDEKIAAAIRRIAELEEERERVRSLLDLWASGAHKISSDGGEPFTVATLLECCDELRAEMGL